MKTLIIIPGWVTKFIIEKDRSICEFYENVIQILSNYFDVKIVEFPGFGNNPEPQSPLKLDDFVDYLRDFIIKNRIKEFALLGHSFGGQVAAKFAYLYPCLEEEDKEKHTLFEQYCLKKLILYNAACIRRPKKFPNILENIGRKIFSYFPFLRKIFYRFFIGSTEYLKLSKVMQKTMSNILEEDLTEILPKIKTKTLVLWGSYDKITPLNIGLKIKSLIPNSKFIVHPGGHSFHLEDPKSFCDYIINFLRE